MNLEACPITITEANDFVAEHHRHSKKTQGGRFAIGAIYNGQLVAPGQCQPEDQWREEQTTGIRQRSGGCVLVLTLQRILVPFCMHDAGGSGNRWVAHE